MEARFSIEPGGANVNKKTRVACTISTSVAKEFRELCKDVNVSGLLQLAMEKKIRERKAELGIKL